MTASIVAVHSFRGGTGKSNLTANVAAMLAAGGRHVGIIDTDIQSPGVHVIFGLGSGDVRHSLNDYLWGRCQISEAAHDVTSRAGAGIGGRIWLIPSSINPGDIARVMHEGYDVGLLNDGFRSLIRELHLDVLLIDTHPGLNEETLLSIAICDTLAVVLRPDQQDYEGTSVAVSVARKLQVPRMLLVVNKTPAVFDAAQVRIRVESTYGCPVAAVFPHSDDLMVLSSAGIFVAQFPGHEVSGLFGRVAAQLVG